MQTQTVGAFGNLYSRPFTATVGVRWIFILSSQPAHSRESGKPVLATWLWAPACAGTNGTKKLRRRLQRLHAHLVQNIADRREHATHMVRIKPANAADAEGVRDRELARIDHIAPLFQGVIEDLKLESRVSRHA